MNSTFLLRKVIKDYTQIAEDFNITRKSPWPEFELFEKSLNKNSKNISLLDLGCGNGRLYDFLDHKRISYIGADNNNVLLRIAKKLHPKAKFIKADIANTLPFKSGSFDTIWCIATLHHLPTIKLQLKALHEMKRVLKKDGILMLTVWNLWQLKYKKYINPAPLFSQKKWCWIKGHSAFIPWGKEKKVKRFYYAFSKIELKNLLKKAGFSKLKTIKSKHNFAYIAS